MPAPRALLVLPLLLCIAAAPPAKTPRSVPPVREEPLTLEKIFPKTGLFGPSAYAMSFSHDGKYAAYLYRGWEERRHGSDLWLLNVGTGKVERITSVAVMAKFQESARKVKADREKKAKGTWDPTKKAFWGRAGTAVPPNDASAGGAPRYDGIGWFVWSPVAHELLFLSEWDIYRWKVGDREPTRLTRTRAFEHSIQYLRDGKGYTYLVNGALMKVQFGSHLSEQIDPKLPGGESMGEYRISPDGKHLVFKAYKRGAGPAPARKVSIASYRDRFMKVQEVDRHLPEDPLPPTEESIYLYTPGDAMTENGTLTQIYHHKVEGPRDLISLPAWSPDSRKVVFAVYRQPSGQVHVLEALVAEKGKKARVVYKFLHTGGPNTPSMIHPRYLADNRRVALLTEQSGFRHLHLLDPLYESLEQVTFGRYEVYPLSLSKDRKSYYVAATKEHPSCQDLYRVSLEDRKMERLTRECGVWENAVVSPDGKNVLAGFRRYGTPRELVHLQAGGSQVTLTDSHPDSTKKLLAVRPEFFTYKNRHGHDIHGFLFKPAGWSKADKRPLLIYVYGGPLGTTKEVAEGSYRPDSYFFARYMAQKHGYVTCTIDPRGMSGYGSLFEKANFKQVGKPQAEDLVDGVKYLVANHGVDAKKVGMHGWSFGGFQTQMCLYTQPDVFACGIAGAGPTEWENYNSWYSTATIGESRTGQPDLGSYSLLPLAKNLKSRLLLVHGMEDSNVLYQDTVRVYRELLKAGKETLVELFLDPTGGHALGGDVSMLARCRKYEEFLVRCLGEGTAGSAALAARVGK